MDASDGRQCNRIHLIVHKGDIIMVESPIRRHISRKLMHHVPIRLHHVFGINPNDIKQALECVFLNGVMFANFHCSRKEAKDRYGVANSFSFITMQTLTNTKLWQLKSIQNEMTDLSEQAPLL